jgi:hypothetical protein
MNTKVFNLFLMVIWVAVLIGLLTRDAWMSPEMLEKVNGPHTPMVIAVTAMLCVWNLVRFWVAWKLNRPPDPTEREAMRAHIRRKFGSDPKVTDPQFNFDDPPPRSSP